MSEVYEKVDRREHNNFYPTRDNGHRERMLKKTETLDSLRALYDEWKPYKEPDDSYMLHLAKRIHRAEVQLRNMRP